jgi:hypothetical protein
MVCRKDIVLSAKVDETCSQSVSNTEIWAYLRGQRWWITFLAYIMVYRTSDEVMMFPSPGRLTSAGNGPEYICVTKLYPLHKNCIATGVGLCERFSKLFVSRFSLNHQTQPSAGFLEFSCTYVQKERLVAYERRWWKAHRRLWQRHWWGLRGTCSKPRLWYGHQSFFVLFLCHHPLHKL